MLVEMFVIIEVFSNDSVVLLHFYTL